MSALALALSGQRPELPAPGDYIRITNEIDVQCGQVAEVLEVTNRSRPGAKRIYIMLNPFGGGVKTRREIDPNCFDILNAMEVIAEASK